MNRDFIWEEKVEETEYILRRQALIIRFRCDVDHHNALRIRTKADRLIERGGVKNIVFDFTGVRFMDSSGIGVIMGRYKKVIFQGGKIAVTGVGSEVDRILLVSGLYRVMGKYDSVEDALEGMNQKAEVREHERVF